MFQIAGCSLCVVRLDELFLCNMLFLTNATKYVLSRVEFIQSIIVSNIITHSYICITDVTVKVPVIGHFRRKKISNVRFE